jgi:hypothetical protein
MFTALATGGDNRIRTCDILLAKQALYQLSYIPNYYYFFFFLFPRLHGSRKFSSLNG